MKPLIGVTTYGRYETEFQNTDYGPIYFTTADYVDAIRKAGAQIVLVSPGESVFPDILDRLDGIVFSGGADIDPVQYGGDRGHPALGRHDGERDRVEIAGVRASLGHPDMPILCICRGMQVLNVALGGTLFEEVSDREDSGPHRDPDGEPVMHEARVLAGTRTAAALGTLHAHVSSEHHQGLRTAASVLTVTAWAPDGLIEAVEHVDHPWCIGVQWHPEITARTDPVQQRLFNVLVSAAQEHCNRAGG